MRRSENASPSANASKTPGKRTTDDNVQFMPDPFTMMSENLRYWIPLMVRKTNGNGKSNRGRSKEADIAARVRAIQVPKVSGVINTDKQIISYILKRLASNT